MPFTCSNGRCETPCWMRNVLLLAGAYHLLFAVWANVFPCHWFDLMGVEHPNHPMLWRGVGLMIGLLGVLFLFAARNPITQWKILLAGFMKFSLGIAGFTIALLEGKIHARAAGVMLVDDVIWWLPFATMLWICIRAHTGVPPTRSRPYSIQEAAGSYQLSNGKSLAAASENKTLALVFLRHFGCTFTRQILRGLEELHEETRRHGAELVLIHMLQSGSESRYVADDNGVARISDSRCELYRAFGLGKGGFLELFGPHVWWRGAISLFKGCGVGHLAGDGLQMPGAFLFRNGEIISSQPARSASDLPDLPRLFEALPSPAQLDTVSA